MRRPTARNETALWAQVVETTEALGALAEPWDALAARAGVTIFQTHEWVSAWWEILGEGRTLRVITVWQDAHLVGIAPFFLEPARTHGLPFTNRLRFLGGEESDYHQVIAAPGLEEPVAECIAAHLTASPEWDLLVFEDVPDGCIPIRSLLAALGRRGCRRIQRVHHRCYTVPLPPSYDEYLARLDPHRRKEFRRLARRLRERGMVLRSSLDVGVADVPLQKFIDLHSSQRDGEVEHWALADLQIQRFHQRIARAFRHRGWLDLVFLYCHADTIAASYDFRYGGKVYAYLSALSLDSSWTKFSPGMILNLSCIERAIVAGCAEYDLMRGSEKYKSTLRAVQTTNYLYEVTAPRRAAAFRVGIQRALLVPPRFWRWTRRKARGARRRLDAAASHLRGVG